jgi:hypothetical protein
MGRFQAETGRNLCEYQTTLKNKNFAFQAVGFHIAFLS